MQIMSRLIIFTVFYIHFRARHVFIIIYTMHRFHFSYFSFVVCIFVAAWEEYRGASVLVHVCPSVSACRRVCTDRLAKRVCILRAVAVQDPASAETETVAQNTAPLLQRDPPVRRTPLAAPL